MKTAKSIFGIFVFLVLLAMQSPGQSFLTNGLVSYYPFSGNANDVVGTNNGTVFGAVLSTNRFGQTNSAYSFNGSSAYIDLGQPGNLAFTNNFTLSAWCLFNGGSSNPRIICYNEDLGYDLVTFGTGSCRSFGAYIGNNSTETSGCFSQNTWNAVALVVTNGTMTIYVNGVAEATGSTAPIIIQGHLYIGRSTSADYWGGLMSNVRFYNRALPSNQVAQLYAVESGSSILQLTQDLTNSAVLNGQNTTLSVSATDTVPISYQWYFNPNNNGGEAGAYAETTNGFVYGAVVTNGGFGYGVVPSISFVGGGAGVAAKGYATISEGAITGITVTNAGSGYAGVPAVVIGVPNGLIYGQTNSTLTISNASANSLGNYFVVLSDTNGNDITSSVDSLTLVYPPSITNNPVGFSASLGGSGSLSVAASGTSPLSYQWILNNTNVTGATNSIYDIASLDLTNTGSYVVEVSNPYGSAYSTPVNVFMLPSLDAPFTGAVGIWGQSVDLNVGAEGSGMLNYQWYFNGQAISGANSSSYDLNSIQFTNAGLYSVVVSSAYGSVTNAAYQVVVNPSNTSLALRPDVIIQGTVGYSYTIESNTNLSNSSSWMVETNITLTAPTYEWIDYSVDASKSPPKFYQVLPGQ